MPIHIGLALRQSFDLNLSRQEADSLVSDGRRGNINAGKGNLRGAIKEIRKAFGERGFDNFQVRVLRSQNDAKRHDKELKELHSAFIMAAIVEYKTPTPANAVAYDEAAANIVKYHAKNTDNAKADNDEADKNHAAAVADLDLVLTNPATTSPPPSPPPSPALSARHVSLPQRQGSATGVSGIATPPPAPISIRHRVLPLLPQGQGVVSGASIPSPSPPPLSAGHVSLPQGQGLATGVSGGASSTAGPSGQKAALLPPPGAGASGQRQSPPGAAQQGTKVSGARPKVPPKSGRVIQTPVPRQGPVLPKAPGPSVGQREDVLLKQLTKQNKVELGHFGNLIKTAQSVMEVKHASNPDYYSEERTTAATKVEKNINIGSIEGELSLDFLCTNYIVLNGKVEAILMQQPIKNEIATQLRLFHAIKTTTVNILSSTFDMEKEGCDDYFSCNMDRSMKERRYGPTLRTESRYVKINEHEGALIKHYELTIYVTNAQGVTEDFTVPITHTTNWQADTAPTVKELVCISELGVKMHNERYQNLKDSEEDIFNDPYKAIPVYQGVDIRDNVALALVQSLADENKGVSLEKIIEDVRASVSPELLSNPDQVALLGAAALLDRDRQVPLIPVMLKFSASATTS